MSKISFRFAEARDCGLILDFIKKLAIYEKMEQDVIATPEKLYHTLFEKKYAEVLFIMSDRKEVGFALFFHNYSTFLGQSGIFLEDLYVLEEERGKGYGKALIRKLAAIALERNCGRLEWNCLKWNSPSLKFYQGLGAVKMEEWVGLRLTRDAMENLAEKGPGKENLNS